MTKHLYFIRPGKLCFLLLFILTSFSAVAQTAWLKNDKLQLKFGRQGLELMTDKRLGKDFVFLKDGFSISINGNVYDHTTAVLEDIKTAERSIEYLYKVKGFGIKITYELRKDWFFLSRMLEVNAEKEDSFRVNHVKLFDLQTAEKIISMFVPTSRTPQLNTRDYGSFLRFGDATGLLVTVQNPFLTCRKEDNNLCIEYQPDIIWKKTYGPFQSDAGNVAGYALSGNRLPARMTPEWKWTRGVVHITDQEQDQAEVDAFTAIVSNYILPHSERTIKMNVGWCENDYQIDISKEEGRIEYKRIIDQAAAMGMEHILFTPSNAELGSKLEATDDWGWENLLWLGLGIKIRKGEWNVEKDTVPASIQELLDYSKSKSVKLVSYLYPILPFAGNDEWIVEGSPFHKNKKHASLGVRSFQDYLINILSSFYERTGISGYSYDYTYLWYEGTSRYAQWSGWCRVKETLRKKYPEMILDGRQLDQLYGPWSWRSGSFPHPTAEDEQPESFTPFPDLHFDRVSANRQRYTAYRYRSEEYCPPAVMPGFMFHQTPRHDVKNGKVVLPLKGFRRRDWDYLGWKYSLFSSIATGGLNNVVNMIPARDIDEFQHFADTDKKFIRDWLNWTDENRSYLMNTRFIMGQPALGKTDGTTAIKDSHGYIFLFNPNARKSVAEFFLDESIGLTKTGNYQISIIHPHEGQRISAVGNAGQWQYGDRFRMQMDGASYLVLSISHDSAAGRNFVQLYDMKGVAHMAGNSVNIDQAEGEVGSVVNWKLKLPDNTKLLSVVINGRPVSFSQSANLVSGRLHFAGISFSPMQQIGSFNPFFSGGQLTSSFTIPAWVFDQLNERRKRWPIPWTAEDHKTTWLVPGRLLLFIQVGEPADTMDVHILLDSKPLPLSRAYSSVRPNAGSFVGWYADVTDLAADKLHKISLTLPPLRQGQFQGLFFENIEKKMTRQFTVVNAR